MAIIYAIFTVERVTFSLTSGFHAKIEGINFKTKQIYCVYIESRAMLNF